MGGMRRTEEEDVWSKGTLVLSCSTEGGVAWHMWGESPGKKAEPLAAL